ncbi:MAG: TIGR02221 family CRISPR-associated protein [Rhodocyclaceae bacterium]|nr:TIGR02221 family CRISPR-associated protein [Rhodocyclaceae bacterium]
MPTTLITFLGRVPLHQGGTYRSTTYVLDDARFETRFLGTGLARVLDVDVIRILGTTGSMWDVLADELDARGGDDDWLALSDAARHDRVSAEQLQAVESCLNARGGRRFELRLIPYGFEERVQADILRALSEGHERAGRRHIVLDITHGLRHLPMLGLLCALYLRALGHAQITDIVYGAFDVAARDGATPVVRLNGLLTMQEWIRRLEQFDKDGDYGSFADLLEQDGLPGKLLREAAFLERVGNLSLARKKLDTFWQQAGQPATPAGTLFFPALRERLAWRTAAKHSEWERRLARLALDKADYLRATIFAFESRISARVEQMGGNINDYLGSRSQAEKQLAEETKEERIDYKSERNFITLSFLRNQLAHGVRANVASASWFTQRTAEHVAGLAGDEARLKAWLGRALEA